MGHASRLLMETEHTLINNLPLWTPNTKCMPLTRGPSPAMLGCKPSYQTTTRIITLDFTNLWLRTTYNTYHSTLLTAACFLLVSYVTTILSAKTE